MSEVSDISLHCQQSDDSPRNNALGSGINGGNSNARAVLSVTQKGAFTDDIFNVIRAIVPPPPPVQTCLSHGDHSSSGYGTDQRTNEFPEILFSRRSTEECLLGRMKSHSSSAKEARINLEELFFQIIEPKKSTNQDMIMLSVLELMEKWSMEEAIQQSALSCFLCLSQQYDIFHLSKRAASSIVNCMKSYYRNETVQRTGVKLLKDKRVLRQVHNKDEVACIVFNSLCEMHHVNDFIVYAKDIVEEVGPAGRMYLRTSKAYVEMLLNFPYRKDVTIYLSWCALDTLVLLADFQVGWNLLLDLDGKSRIEKLSQRPEFEDRCRILIERAFPKQYNNAMRISISPQNEQTDNLPSTNVTIVRKPLTPLLRLGESSKLIEGSGRCFHASVISMNGMAQYEKSQKSMEGNSITSESAVSHMIFVPVDELVTRQPPTPPPTLDDLEYDGGEFSDDDNVTSNQEFPSRDCIGYCTPSPSYSPPPEILAHNEEEYHNLFSPTPTIGNGLGDFSALEENTSYDRINGNLSVSTEKVSDKIFSRAEVVHTTTPLLNGKFNSVFPCFICREPRVKQSLLLKQLNQISHCLHQPCNKLLLKCLQSNVCGDHKM